jgi:hypothetical protein
MLGRCCFSGVKGDSVCHFRVLWSAEIVVRKHKARTESRARARKRVTSVPLSRLSRRSAEARTRAIHVLAEMRHDEELKLSSTARSFGVKPSVVRKYFGSSFNKVNGRWRVSKSDRFRETMYVPDARGNPVPVPTANNKQRAEVSAFLRDIGRFYRGNKSAMAKWHGKRIAGVELVTASRTLLSIESQLSDFAIYRAFNGAAE